MSKFKVTLRKNGKAVGEMHYGSEAVAVTKAKAMKDATGCDVTVAPAKANPPAKTRAPRDAAYWVRSAVSALDAGAPTSAADDIRKALRLLPANSPVEPILVEAIEANARLGYDRNAVYPLLERALRHFGPRRSGAKANPRRAATRRRNGTGLSRASMHSRARAGSPAKMSERLKALGLAFEDFGKAGSALYPVWNDYRVAQHWAEQTSRGSSPSSVADARVAFQQFIDAERVLLDAVGTKPRRNGETTMWTVRVGSQEIGEFHAASRLTAAIARKAAEIAAEQGYTAAYFKRWGSVSDGMHRHPVAQFLKNGHRCNPSCGCPKSNPKRKYRVTWHERDAHGRTEKFSTTVEANNRNDVLWQFRQHGSVEVTPIRAAARRRNGTTAGEAAASRSLAHRAAMIFGS